MSVLAAGKGVCGATDFFAREASERGDFGVGIDENGAGEIFFKCSDLLANTVHISSGMLSASKGVTSRDISCCACVGVA